MAMPFFQIQYSETLSNAWNLDAAVKMGNYYPTTKALRIYSDGFHKNTSMYLEYTLNGTKYSGEYDIKNI